MIGKYPWETPGNVFEVSTEGGGKRERRRPSASASGKWEAAGEDEG